MKVKTSDLTDLRTTVPVELEIFETSTRPKVSVSNMGEVPVQKWKKSYISNFWLEVPGAYRVKVLDPKTGDKWEKDLFVQEQIYLSFSQEFGFFLILFFLMGGGLILWIRKIKKSA